MPIPERQLETWAKYHSTDKAQYTHKLIREAIRNYDYSRNYDFEDYLQGSYKSNTNIWADTDVDIVVQLNSEFQSNINNLIFEQRKTYVRAYRSKILSNIYKTTEDILNDFREDIIKALRNKFGYFKVKIGNKSVKVLPDDSGNRYKADVVIALQYRLYVQTRRKNTTFDPETGLYYYEGIWFRTSSSEEIINFPKLHLKNGSDKNQKTNGKFKPVVRIFKNMRNKAIELGYLPSKEIAPSYFIQCLLYNVPDNVFLGSFQEIVYKILNWLSDALYDYDDYTIERNFRSQNEIVPLFGQKNDKDKWNIHHARIFLNALIKMWNEWK